MTICSLIKTGGQILEPAALMDELCPLGEELKVDDALAYCTSMKSYL